MDRYAHQSLWVPLPFCNHVVLENYIKEAKFFIAVKMLYGGQFKLNKTTKKEITHLIGKDVRTVYRRLNALRERNWIGNDPVSGYYFIRGFKKIYALENLKGRSAAYFVTEWLNDFKAFIGGAIIGHLVHQQKRGGRSWSSQRESSAHGSCHPHYKPVATKAIEKIFDLSYGTAYRLKQRASDANFIKVSKNFNLLNLKVEYLPLLKKYSPEISKKSIVYKGKIYLKAPDLIKPVLYYKRIKR